MFAATLVATYLTPVPYGFIYPIGFIIIVGSYVAWSIFGRDIDATKMVEEPWDSELPPINEDSKKDQPN